MRDEAEQPLLLDPRTADTVARIGRTHVVPPASIICEQGRPIGSCYLIAEGIVEVVISHGGQCHPISRHGPGCVVALMAALDGGPCRVGINAMGPVKLVEISREKLLAALSDGPATCAPWVERLTILAIRRLRLSVDELAQAIHRSMTATGQRPGRIDAGELACVHARNHLWEPAL